ERATLGRTQFVVGLYRAGDEEARLVAHQFVQAELRLRQVAIGHHQQLERHAYPTMIHKVGAMLSITDSKLPHNWVDAVVYSAPARENQRVTRQLPPAVKQAVENYLTARRELVELSVAGS